MIIFNIYKRLLLVVYFSQKFESPTYSNDPVCVVGAGISGIAAANRLKDKGYTVRIFEKLDRVGGKIESYRRDGITWNMGPVILTDQYTRALEVIKKYNINYTSARLGDFVGYQPNTGFQIKLPEISEDEKVKAAFARYREIRKNLIAEPGNINTSPELFVSTSEWLKANDLQDLEQYALIFLTAEGYGHIEDTPALYFTYLADLTRDIAIDFHYIHDGMDQIPIAWSKNLNVTLNADISNIERNENGAKLKYSLDNRDHTQKCSSVILALPPLLNQVSKIVPDLSKVENEILDQVKFVKYASIASYTPNMKHIGYAPLLPPPLPPKLDGGHPALIANQTKGAAVSYHWTRGEFNAGPTNDELDHYQSELDKIFPWLFPSKETKTNIYVKGWDYFPHVTSESLKNGFYKKFNSIQGKDNIYYATPLLSFESVETSIRAAEYVVDTFY